MNPDDLVDEFGADTVRTYLMFAFEWEKGGPWDSRGIRGAQRFIVGCVAVSAGPNTGRTRRPTATAADCAQKGCSPGDNQGRRRP